MPNNFKEKFLAQTHHKYRMTSTSRLAMPSEYRKKAVDSGYSHLREVLFFLFSAVTIFLSFAVFTPTALFATEKKAGENGKIKPDQTKRAEGFLANAEQMIEQMVMQIERQNANGLETGEFADNPDPTSFVSSVPNIKPVNGSITSTFGLRVHPLYNLSLFHQGIDMAASEGTKVQTTGDGIVVYSGYDKGYGQTIAINHGYGYKTIYAHLSKLLVQQGKKVCRGDIIALSGNTGISTAPHLHYEVQKDNVKVNPTAYFFNDINPDKFITTQKSSLELRDNHS